MNFLAITNIVTLLLTAYFPSAIAEQSQPNTEEPEPPLGFEQLLQRGALASIDHPVFVSAEEASISDDAWVLGVVIDGESRAYSLRLLNSHEIVNDVISEQPVAAVW